MDRVREYLKLPPPSAVDGSGVLVAVLDTGVDQGHPDFVGRISPTSRSLAPLDSRLIDEVGHGTHVAGIIAGTGAASAGRYVGVSPGATLLVLRVATDITTYSDTVAEAVLFAVEKGADIINYSSSAIGFTVGPPPWAWSPERRSLDRAFEFAFMKGVLCVSAAGNEGPEVGSMAPPGIFREVVAVGCTGLDGLIAEGSSRGPVYFDPGLKRGAAARYDEMLPGGAKVAPYDKPDLVAPGGHFEPFGHRPPHRRVTSLLGLEPTGLISCRSRLGKHQGLPGERDASAYTMLPGTSMACAVISGMAALALDYGARCGLNWGPERAKALQNLLRKAARRPPNGPIEVYGSGTPLWPVVASLIEDCAGDPDRRNAVLYGPQLSLLDNM